MIRPIELILTYSKSTKNKHVYCDNKPDAAIPSLYINKSRVPAAIPKTIKITLDVVD